MAAMGIPGAAPKKARKKGGKKKVKKSKKVAKKPKQAKLPKKVIMSVPHVRAAMKKKAPRRHHRKKQYLTYKSISPSQAKKYGLKPGTLAYVRRRSK